MHKYTEEEIKDVKGREEAALAYLKENGLSPAAQVTSVNVGNDLFATRVQCYLQDTKYTEKEIVSDNPEVNPKI